MRRGDVVAEVPIRNRPLVERRPARQLVVEKQIAIIPLQENAGIGDRLVAVECDRLAARIRQPGVGCVRELVVAGRRREAGRRVLVEEADAVFVRLVGCRPMPAMHVHQQQVAAPELGIHERIVVRDHCGIHLQGAAAPFVYPFKAMRPRRDEELPALGVEVGEGHDGEQPVHRRPHRPPALVVVVLRDARPAGRAVVDDEGGQDGIVAEQCPRCIEDGRVTDHEPEVGVGHAALGERVASRRGILARQRPVQRRMAAERRGEAFDLGVVQRVAHDQVAIACVAFNIVRSQHQPSPAFPH